MAIISDIKMWVGLVMRGDNEGKVSSSKRPSPRNLGVTAQEALSNSQKGTPVNGSLAKRQVEQKRSSGLNFIQRFFLAIASFFTKAPSSMLFREASEELRTSEDPYKTYRGLPFDELILPFDDVDSAF